MKGLERRIGKLEARLPSPEDEDARKREAFLHGCTDQELRLLQRIAEARENGEELPSLTEEEERVVSAVLERWNALCAAINF